MPQEKEGGKAAFKLEPEKIQKKLKESWIKSWMMIEALAVTEAAARSALENHVRKLGLEKGVMIAKKDFKKVEKVSKPFENIKTAYSGVVELEVLTKDYDRLVFLVLNYAPSAIEVLEPKKISIDAGEAQGILNSLAELMHRFVGLTRGGIMVDTK
jgi:SpoU rRNA methylase family enzyme